MEEQGTGETQKRGLPSWASAARHLLLRLAIAFVFLSFGIWELIDPQYWVGFIPGWTMVLGPAVTIAMLHGAVLVLVGLAVLLGLWLRWSALLASLMLLEICLGLLLSSGFSDLLVRDVGLLLVAVALIFDREHALTFTS